MEKTGIEPATPGLQGIGLSPTPRRLDDTFKRFRLSMHILTIIYLWIYKYYDVILFSEKEESTSILLKYLLFIICKYIEDIQFFGMNMPFFFIEWSEKCIFHEWRSHEWNIHFLASRDEIDGIFIPKIWIFFLLYTIFKCNRFFCSKWRHTRSQIASY